MRVRSQVVNFVKKPMPAGLPTQTTRALLGLEDQRVVPIVRDAAKVNEESDAVFYFPGCGSERLFSDIGLATLAMLLGTGVGLYSYFAIGFYVAALSGAAVSMLTVIITTWLRPADFNWQTLRAETEAIA